MERLDAMQVTKQVSGCLVLCFACGVTCLLVEDRDPGVGLGAYMLAYVGKGPLCLADGGHGGIAVQEDAGVCLGGAGTGASGGYGGGPIEEGLGGSACGVAYSDTVGDDCCDDRRNGDAQYEANHGGVLRQDDGAIYWLEVHDERSWTEIVWWDFITGYWAGFVVWLLLTLAIFPLLERLFEPKAKGLGEPLR